jgi:hypothetical protein
MPPDTHSPPDRAFPYWAGWHSVGCSVLLYGLIGSIGVSLFPTGYEKLQSGQLPTGIALMVMAAFGVPTLAMAFWSVIAGVRDTFRPPMVSVAATGLVLPRVVRGEPPEDEHGLPTQEPPQPREVPFAAIRRVTRSGPRFNELLEVAHDLAAEPLTLRQHMMRAADFEELEKLLRAAVPQAFAEREPSAHG